MIYQRYFIQIETTQIRSQGISEPICECQRVSRRVVSNLGWEIIFELVWFCRCAEIKTDRAETRLCSVTMRYQSARTVIAHSEPGDQV
jgi:hypothetical protein